MKIKRFSPTYFFSIAFLLICGQPIHPAHAQWLSESRCADVEQDFGRVSLIKELHYRHHLEGAEFAKEQLDIFFDDPSVSMDRLIIGAYLSDLLQHSPPIKRMVGASALLLSKTYQTGYARDSYELYCRAREEIPSFVEALDAYLLDSVEGDKNAVSILDSIKTPHAARSFLYARIFLPTYTHRDYFFARHDDYLDQGIDHLIEAWQSGATSGQFLPYWYVNRLNRCLGEEAKNQLIEDGVDLAWGIQYLEKTELIDKVAPQCSSIVSKVQSAMALYTTNIASQEISGLGESSTKLLAVLRGKGGTQYYKGYSYALCKLSRSLLYEAAIAGDTQAINLYLELTREEDKIFAAAWKKYGIGQPVPEEEQSDSCSALEREKRLTLLEKLYDSGEATSSQKLALGFGLFEENQISRAGYILFNVAKLAKEDGDMKLLFLINDYFVSNPKLKESFFAKQMEGLLVD